MQHVGFHIEHICLQISYLLSSFISTVFYRKKHQRPNDIELNVEFDLRYNDDDGSDFSNDYIALYEKV